jgi:phenylalanyl-tRNA synthetase alpha chain
MIDRVKKYLKEVQSFSSTDLKEVELFRINYAGKKGILNDLFLAFREIPINEKKEFGKELNKLKDAVNDKVKYLQSQSKRSSGNIKIDDPSRTAFSVETGNRHPLSIVKNRIIDIFTQIGFSISEGPEIEDDWHNFTALNLPKHHPARDMQDTFFIEKGANEIALRTHTSSVQVRVMEGSTPPIRTISPGRVYRNEAISARAHCFFHQIEGLYIDEDVSFADLKQTLLFFAQEVFGSKAKIRLRPSYFPFTEPSAEVDVSCTICNSKGCNVCKYTGWLEILGCGMVDPNVLEASGIDSKKYSGFAFGMGVERIAQLKFKVNDLRMYSENDLRFLNQFKSTL